LEHKFEQTCLCNSKIKVYDHEVQENRLTQYRKNKEEKYDRIILIYQFCFVPTIIACLVQNSNSSLRSEWAKH